MALEEYDPDENEPDDYDSYIRFILGQQVGLDGETYYDGSKAADSPRDRCRCAHSRAEHSGELGGCSGELITDSPPVPQFSHACVCPAFELWYRGEKD